MAERSSRRAWEIISSHRAATEDDFTALDIDEYLSHNTPYSDLVEGWSAVLSDDYVPSSQPLDEADYRECSDRNDTPQLTDSTALESPSSLQLPLSCGGQSHFHNSSFPFTSSNTATSSEDPNVNSSRPILKPHESDRSDSMPFNDLLVDTVSGASSPRVDLQLTGASYSEPTCQLLSLTSEKPDRNSVSEAEEPVNLVPVDYSLPVEVTELGHTDPSLAAVEGAITQRYLFDLDMSAVEREMSELSANLAQCLLEKSLLEEQLKQEESHSPSPDLQPEPPITLYGDGERYVLYPDLDTPVQHQDCTLVNTLEEQLEKFVDQRKSLYMSRVDKWNDETLAGDDPNFHLSVFSLPDEVLLRIFSYVPLKELMMSLSIVCRRWYVLSFDPYLWQHLFIPTDSTIEPHWLCLVASRAPQLKTLSVRGGHNIREECLSVITNHCHQLTTVDLGFCDVTLPMLTQLVTRCPRISSVNFEGCECVDSGWVRQLCQLKELMCVDLSHCVKLADDDIIYLSENTSHLIYVNIDGQSFLSDRSVVPLCKKHSETLRLLSIDGAESTDASVEAISHCTHLLRLTISFADRLTEQSVHYLQKVKCLAHLQIRKNQVIRSDAFCRMFQGATMQNLHHLDLSECLLVDDSVVQAICKRCVHLTELLLCWCWNITDQGLEYIVESCENVTYLDLLGIDQIEGHCFNRLPAKLPHLTFLNLVQCNRIQDNLIKEVLKRMPQLTAINFYHEDFRQAT